MTFSEEKLHCGGERSIKVVCLFIFNLPCDISTSVNLELDGIHSHLLIRIGNYFEMEYSRINQRAIQEVLALQEDIQ